MAMNDLPKDPAILLSFINTRLHDEFPDGLDALCAALSIDRRQLEQQLADAGFVYNPEQNRFW